MQKKTKWLLKIGGSLEKRENFDGFANGDSLPKLLTEIKKIKSDTDIVISPGGGLFADFVRSKESIAEVGNRCSHAQAVLACAQFGYEIVDKLEGGVAVRDRREVEKSWNDGKIPVFIPYPFAVDDDKIPHDWNATSDTIAIRACSYLGIENLILVKPVDGNWQELVDSEFSKHVTENMEIRVVNGFRPQALSALMREV